MSSARSSSTATPPGYGPLRRFAAAASGLVGAWVNVVTDDAPAAEVSALAL